MKKISFNEGTLTFDRNKVTYEIPLEKTNLYSVDEVHSIKILPHMFPITNLNIQHNFFSMEIEVERGFVPLSMFKSSATDDDKYEFIRKLCSIVVDFSNSEQLVTVLDDKNVLINPITKEIKFLYRGIRGLMPSGTYKDESLIEQVKRLSLFILTSAKYDEIRVNGLDIALNKTTPERYKLVSKVFQAPNFEAVLSILNELAEEEKTNDEDQMKKVSFLSKIQLMKNNVKKNVDTEKKDKDEKRLNRSRTRTKVKQKIEDVEDTNEVKSNEPKKFNKDFINKLKTDKTIKIIVGTLAATAIIAYSINMFNENNDSKSSAVTLANSENDKDLLLKGLQYAAIQDYDAASEYFDKITTSFQQLDEENQKAVLFSYLMDEQYQKAIDTEPVFAYSVINYLVSKDNLSAIKDIKSDEPVILFEKAAINQEFEEVLKYKDEIRLDGRRESIIVSAYIALKKYDEGLVFAKAKGNTDLINKVETIIKEEEAKKQQELQEPQNSEQNTENNTDQSTEQNTSSTTV